MKYDLYKEYKKITKCNLPSSNIQAIIFLRLWELGIVCFLEHSHKFFGKRLKPDISIFKDGLLSCVVEVKSYRSNCEKQTKTKQIDKYKKLGCPVFLVTRLEQVNETIESIIKYIC